MELNLKLIDSTTDLSARAAMVEYFSHKIEKASNKELFYKLKLETAAEILSKIPNISSNLVVKILKGFVNTYGKKAVSLLAYINCNNLKGNETEIFEILSCIPVIKCLSEYKDDCSGSRSEDDESEEGALMVDYQWCYEQEKELTRKLSSEIKVLKTSSTDFRERAKIIQSLITDHKEISVTSSCTDYSAKIDSLLDLSHKFRFSSKDVMGTWVEYSFKEHVQADGYEIMTNGDYRTPRSWKIEIIPYSSENLDLTSSDWKIIDEKKECKDLPNRSIATVTFNIKLTEPFRRLRFTQTNKNAAGTHCFIFKYFEIIGFFVR